jgi:hypothetical protein
MPTNNKTDACLRTERGALVFWAPDQQPRRYSSRVQTIDVFSLQVATGYSRDPQGRLLLEAQTSVAAGRSWTLAKAAQLIRNDARPHRWVALQMDKRAWGLFWAGGGLQRCRELLADRVSDAEASPVLVPATSEAVLQLILDMKPHQQVMTSRSLRPEPAPEGMPSTASTTPAVGPNPWQVVGCTSLVWLVVLERQDRKLELLLQRTAPAESIRP